MPHIKVTGTLDTDELPANYVDLDHPSGLTEEGHEALFSIFSDETWKLSDLQDVDSELES
jgi:hypothetical protein